MAIKDSENIKKIICSNFDRSARLYENYEHKYGLFKYLTEELAKVCNIRKGMSVCDIGCGTGASTLTLAKVVGKEGQVIGIDFSKEMIDLAKEELQDFANVELLLCDAEKLGEHIDLKMDAILYNASIFLMPDPKQTLWAAHDVLQKDGIVGMNYLVGIFDDQEPAIDLFRSAKEEGMKFAPYGRRIMNAGALPGILKDVGFGDIREGTISKQMNMDEIREFYSIPAQSAGLYPKTPYDERLELLDELLDHIQNTGIMKFDQVWGWHVAKR